MLIIFNIIKLTHIFIALDYFVIFIVNCKLLGKNLYLSYTFQHVLSNYSALITSNPKPNSNRNSK